MSDEGHGPPGHIEGCRCPECDPDYNRCDYCGEVMTASGHCRCDAILDEDAPCLGLMFARYARPKGGR